MVSVIPKEPFDIAFNVLWRVEKDKAFASPVLNKILLESALSNKEKGVATQLVYGTIRWKLYLEKIIERYLFKPLEKLDSVTKLILVIGTYCILKSRKDPKYVIYKAVEETKNLRGNKMGGLVNAILRKILMDRELINKEEIEEGMEVEEIAWRLSHPEWLFKELVKQYGIDRAISLCKANNMERPITIRVNPHLITREELLKRLVTIYGEERVIPAKYSKFGIYLFSTGNITNTKEYREGLFTIQDEGAQLVTLLLDPKKGERILDATAGRGTKTTFIACLEREVEIDAVDKYPEKLKILKTEFNRLKLNTNLRCYGIDLEIGYGELKGNLYDKIILDAPCTGSGTLRSKVELRYRLQKVDIEEMAKKQLTLLKSVAPLLRGGGKILYIVCSLFEEERWQVIETFLKENPRFYIVPVKEIIPWIPKEFIDKKGGFVTYPDQYSGDGFFGVVLAKR